MKHTNHCLAKQREIITVRESIPHTGPLTKVIPLNLFLDMVPSFSEDVARALRGQPRLSRNGGNVRVIVVVLILFHSRDVFSAFSHPFVRLGFRLLFTRLAVHYLGAYSVLRSFIKQTLLATVTS